MSSFNVACGCENGKPVAPTYKVDIGGGGPTDICRPCTGLNGSYALGWIGDGVYICEWYTALPNVCDGFPALGLSIVGGNYAVLQVLGSDPTPVIWAQYSATNMDPMHPFTVTLEVGQEFYCQPWPKTLSISPVGPAMSVYTYQSAACQPNLSPGCPPGSNLGGSNDPLAGKPIRCCREAGPGEASASAGSGCHCCCGEVEVSPTELTIQLPCSSYT